MKNTINIRAQVSIFGRQFSYKNRLDDTFLAFIIEAAFHYESPY